MTFTKHHAVVDVQLDTLHPNAPIPIGQNQRQGAPAPVISGEEKQATEGFDGRVPIIGSRSDGHFFNGVLWSCFVWQTDSPAACDGKRAPAASPLSLLERVWCCARREIPCPVRRRSSERLW